MKTIIAAIAITLGLLSTSLTASAGYVAPDASWQTRALTGGQD
jgi:hypothetical protein